MSSSNLPETLKEGELNIGDAVLSCAVLYDETRVMSRASFIKALGRTGKAKGGRKYDDEFKTPVFLTAENLKPFVSEDLIKNSAPILYKRINGQPAIGYKAELMPQVCYVFVDADEAGVLRSNQRHIAEKCRILIRGFATVGIIALVDEATGYQNLRARRALEKILEAFISDKLLKWAQRFPDNFYEEIFRLRGWHYTEESIKKRPGIVGKYTNDIVYARLGPCILDELRILNPPDEKGRRKHKHHQWLTEDVGHPALKEHLIGIIALMKASPNWPTFQRLLHRAYPAYNEQLELIYGEADEEMKSDYASIS